ncbi:MAG: hypothetical protein CL840_06470 [Crocinitomicaceae bacterium]|nr:hypothetical protein [Crocinitomicaceae bacterium]|tara:strand:+ start:10734 stop:11252 length:519 start_codon:yes stop_codon:yes gene_type:complete
MEDFVTCPYCNGKEDFSSAFHAPGELPEEIETCFACQDEGEVAKQDFIPIAKRDNEVICMYPFELPSKEGDVYMMLALDLFPDHLFRLGLEKANDIEQILKNIKLLIKQTQFKPTKEDATFTLVLHKYKEHRKDIEKLIKPYGGRLVINDSFLTHYFTPVMMHLTNSLIQRS